ncbi:hypothetical protein Ciccas_010803 [Cichlidogyrus casuarinus]|uniref:Uncharacterized protein n=1 Tax=Cichlidogyrus casuarinus TaxID=1844966 RepID=A0ABD2PT26_9PLAT
MFCFVVDRHLLSRHEIDFDALAQLELCAHKLESHLQEARAESTKLRLMLYTLDQHYRKQQETTTDCEKGEELQSTRDSTISPDMMDGAATRPPVDLSEELKLLIQSNKEDRDSNHAAFQNQTVMLPSQSSMLTSNFFGLPHQTFAQILGTKTPTTNAMHKGISTFPTAYFVHTHTNTLAALHAIVE